MNILQIIIQSCRENPIVAVFIGFFLFFFSMSLVGLLYVPLAAVLMGIAPAEIATLVDKLPDLSANELMFFRAQQGGAQLLTWGLSGGIMASILGGFYAYLYLNKKAYVSQFILAILLILVCIPLVQAVTFNADTFSLPSAFEGLEATFRKSEAKNQSLMFEMLKDPRIGVLILNILLVAVTPAICEEIFFRGFLQRTLAKAWNIHTGIWLSALLFSLMHFQFYGFFSRLLLGALLGYLVYGSGSLWPAIVGHFAFNLMNILMVYSVFNLGYYDESYLQNTASFPVYMVVLSFLGVVGLFFAYFRIGQKPLPSPHP